jgi:pyroglutamyl-peptidase
MVDALLDAGIPARISNTAGTYLCNACLYSFLSAAEAASDRVACGFIHVPYLPSQVADLLRRIKDEGVLELHQRADTASMELATAVRALELAIAAAIRNGP